MFSFKNESKYIKLVLAATCTLFFAICLFSIFKYGNSTLLGNLNNPDNDDVKFIRSAKILLDTGNYVYHRPPNPTVFMMPGLPFALAAFMKFFGYLPALTAFRICQAIIQTLCILLVFLIGRKIFDSKVGAVAAVISTFCIADIWMANLILTETFFKFFVMLLVYFSIYAVEKNKFIYYIGGAIAWGLATLFRPTIATFPIVILIMWVLRKYTIKGIIKNTITVTLIFCMILSPWWIRNYKIFNKFIPLTLATGNPMLQGTYINYGYTIDDIVNFVSGQISGKSTEPIKQSGKEQDKLNYSQFKYTNSEIDNNAVEMAISKYRLKNEVPKHPIQYMLWYTLGKAICQIAFPMYWVQILGINFVIAGLYHYFILITAVAGLIAYFKNKSRDKNGTIVFSSIIYFIVVYLPFYAFPRYFYPAIPFVIIFSAYYITNIWNSKFKKKYIDI